MRRLWRAYQNKSYNGVPLGFDGTEDGGATLTSRERNTLEASLHFREHTEVHVRGVIFRSTQHRKLVTNNTGLMYPFNNGRHVEHAYGTIQRIYEVLSPDLSPPGEPQMPPLIEVAWLTEQPAAKLFGKIPVVKRDPGSLWNRDYRYALIHKAFCWNVVFWPKELAKPRRADEALLAIFRYSKFRPTDR
jgi:hypothetical protein